MRRSPFERLQAWAVTGPLGHLWSVVADIVVLFARARLARLPLVEERSRGGGPASTAAPSQSRD